MHNHQLDILASEVLASQQELVKLRSLRDYGTFLVPKMQPVNVLTQGGIVRVYWESMGARVVAQKVIVSWDLGATAVQMGINEDPMLYNPGSGIGTGIQLYGGPITVGTQLPSIMTIEAPIEFLSFIMAGAAQHIGINVQVGNPAADNGYITTYGWGPSTDGVLLQGNR